VRMYSEGASWKLTSGIEGTCSLDVADMYQCGQIGCSDNCNSDTYLETPATKTETYLV